MNKIAIPALLLGVVMIAGAFAFMPVQEASTVHLSGAGSGSANEFLNVTLVLAGDKDAGSNNAIVLDDGEDTSLVGILVTDSAGAPVVGLVAADFTAAVTSLDGAAVVTVTGGTEIANGLYTMLFDAVDIGGAGFFAWHIVVTVDDVDNLTTTEVGTGVLYLSAEIIA